MDLPHKEPCHQQIIYSSRMDEISSDPLKYNRNSTGPKIVPCGTPHVKANSSDNVFL
jgi:hypothetical protein